ncbi:hypothetical protein EHS39_13920 [Ensifer sp. MPMI2T]|nr:hypothetical protein EHS39_13920 [Ensifer sp. MPMI2T]
MLRFANIVLLVSVISSTANAGAYDRCDQRIEKDEPNDGRFLGVPYAMIAHSLAEKHCGAKPRSMRGKILDFIEENGCGPGTMIYSEVDEAISRMEIADLKQIVFNGDRSINPSPQQIREEAERMVNSLGGCQALIRAHDAD